MLGRRRLFVVTGGLGGGLLLGCHREGTSIPAGQQVAPGFSAQEAGGQTVTLAGMLASGPAVLVFYRGFW